MNSNFNEFYPAKKLYDQFIKELPNYKSFTDNQKTEICFRLYEFITVGLPYKDRPQALSFFYKLIPIDGNPNLTSSEKEKFETIFLGSIYDEEILNYIMQLDPEDIYQVCQIRGGLLTTNLFYDFFMDNKEKIKMNWNKIFEEAEYFIKSEPCLPIKFLETYLDVIYEYGQESQKERIYELGELVLEYSIKISL